MGATRWNGGPHALRERLSSAGARFAVVGSVAAGAAEPRDLDVLVTGSASDLAALLEAVGAIGGRSRLSRTMPTAERLREAGTWQFDTAYGPLDVFVEGGATCV